METTKVDETDVVVVGARCAGAATALLLARQGHRVVLVDRTHFPSDTLSTHALSRGGVVQLARWGLLDELLAAGSPPIRTVSFHVGGTTTEHRIKAKAGVDHLLAPRRHLLDTTLVRAATAAGADLRTGINVTGAVHHLGRVTGITGRDADGTAVTINARFVVGADGLRSRMAREVGAAVVDQRTPGGATHYSYFRAPRWDGFEFHIAPGIMAGVFPTNAGEANVWACSPATATANLAGDDSDRFLDLLARANPILADRMATAQRTAPVRSAFALPNQKREPWGPGWALVGDAGMHRDPVSGHGMTDAFRDAELLARVLDGALRHETSEAGAGMTFRARRNELSAEIFDATVAMSQYPPLEEFVAQQRRATAAGDAEAEFLAALPPWPAPLAAVA